jgi:energy-coupling factor transport system substrate-specific component
MAEFQYYSPRSGPRGENRGRKRYGATASLQSAKAAMAASFLAGALTVWAGAQFLATGKYYFLSCSTFWKLFSPFWRIRGRKNPGRIAVLAFYALSSSGSCGVLHLPQFKPMTAVVTWAACFRGRWWAFDGAVSAFASNIFFGQGPWTPWQMLALA